jgi:hypothetical protein
MVDEFCLGELDIVLPFAVALDNDVFCEFVQNEVTRRGALYPILYLI